MGEIPLFDVESACLLVQPSQLLDTSRPFPNNYMFILSILHHVHMRVSRNGGTPKYNPILGNPHIPTKSQFIQVLLQATQAGNEEMVAKSARGASERTQARLFEEGLSLRK